MRKVNDGSVIYFPGKTAHPEKILILNGRVIDPLNNIDAVRAIAIDNGVIVSVTDGAPAGFSAQRTIDASGKWVVPGLMDMHVHLREPGREDKETIDTGTAAAASGGFTSVACMPNTSPVLDEESKIRYVIQRGENCPCRIYPIGAITKGLEGEELAPVGEMIKAGACAISDDGRSIDKSSVMRNALNYSKPFGIPVICHSEDKGLSQKGHMNEGLYSTKLGIRGIPVIAEDIATARDILIAEYTGARIHIAHVSTAGSVRLVKDAKERGVKVTAETCPHYYTLIDEDIGAYDTNKKMNPPLRTAIDRQAIIDGLAGGVIDCIASDHAPHVSDEKDVEFDAAAFGVVGLETSVGVTLTRLVHTGIITPSDMVTKMSVNPNRILSTSGGSLSVGKPADIAIIDPDREWEVNPENFFSKSRNSAFIGMKLKGCAVMTILGGAVVYQRVQ